MVLLGLCLLVAGISVLGIVFLRASLYLPDISTLTDYQPHIPLRIYSAEGNLIAEYGEERRQPVSLEQVPLVLKHAILETEDSRFFEHNGIDITGIARAALNNITGGSRQGASTITQQVARNFFLSSERTYLRKLYEALVSLKIEEALPKEKILEIYINQIYLGRRAYGFAAAAQIYFGKPLQSITIGEAALLAGLPRGPASMNPITNPKRSEARRQYILGRLKQGKHITEAQFQTALKETIYIKTEGNTDRLLSTESNYAAELARQMTVSLYGERAYSQGLRVYTTLRQPDQHAAWIAVRHGVQEHQRRRGYEGSEGYMKAFSTVPEALDEALATHPDSGELLAGVVIDVSTREQKGRREFEIEIWLRNRSKVIVHNAGLRNIPARFLVQSPDNKKGIIPGAIVRVQKKPDNSWSIEPLPEAQAAFVSLDPNTGAIRSLVGGFDFGLNKFNHVNQAYRQPGSAIKPFIYSAALEMGITPRTLINDAPLNMEDAANTTDGEAWDPRNYDGVYDGPLTLRVGLAKSKNLIAIRVLQQITPKTARAHLGLFGFETAKHPPYLAMALGSGSATPLQMAVAYAVFANGGYRVRPYLIQRITTQQGETLAQATPSQAGDESIRVIDPRNAFLMNSLLREVTATGTAARVQGTLKRSDFAGKTGTTNDYIDAWFAGFHPNLVGIAWIGYGQPRRLGQSETGSVAALPIWMEYMQTMLSKLPTAPLFVPPGISFVDGEWFYQEFAPGGPHTVSSIGVEQVTEQQKREKVREQIF